MAGTWVAGGLLSGPLHLGWMRPRRPTLRRPVVTPVLTGVAAFGAFYAAALVARRIPVLDGRSARCCAYADQGDDPLVLATTLANGVAEEVFFRGALYAAVGARRAGAGSRPPCTCWPPSRPATRRWCWPRS